MPKNDQEYTIGIAIKDGGKGVYWLSQRRGSKQWCRTWYDEETQQTRRRSLGTDDIKIAYKKLQLWYMSEGEVEEKTLEDVTVARVVGRYLVYLKSEKSPSLSSRKSNLKKWTTFYKGKKVSEIDDLKTQKEFIKYLESLGLASDTIKSTLRAGADALNHVAKYDKLDNKIIIQSYEATGEGKRALKLDEVAELFNQCQDENLFLFMMLALNCGQRTIANLELRMDQVNVDGNTIKFNPTGRAQGNKRRATVRITNTLRPLLKNISQASEFVIDVYGKSDISVKAKAKLICKAFNEVKARTSMANDDRVSLYSLRKTIATWLYRSDVDYVDIQYFLGHRVDRITDRYIDVDQAPQYQKEVMEAIDNYFSELAELAADCKWQLDTAAIKRVV